MDVASCCVQMPQLGAFAVACMVNPLTSQAARDTVMSEKEAPQGSWKGTEPHSSVRDQDVLGRLAERLLMTSNACDNSYSEWERFA
eukprot:5258367-Amphidinium_carterae.1